MEQEELINEKRTWLFEQIKSENAAMAGRYRIFLWILCVIYGFFLIRGALQLTGVLEPFNFNAQKELSHFIRYGALLLAGLYSMMAANKMKKAETPEHLLVIYEKNKKIGLCTLIVVLALLVISFYINHGITRSDIITYLFFAVILIAVVIVANRNSQIKQLRELVNS